MLLRIAAFVIRLTGLVFLLFGIACVIAPSAIIQAATGFSVTHAVALIDIRATYGGMSIGVAAILFLLSSGPATIRAGLLSVLALMLGMAGGRLAGLLMVAETNWVMLFYLALELIVASLSAALLYKGARDGEL